MTWLLPIIIRQFELDSKFADAYNNRGLVYDNKGQYDLAFADYNKAIELDPKEAKAYSNRGLAYNLKGQYDIAIADYSKAIELDPQLAVAFYNRGIITRRDNIEKP